MQSNDFSAILFGKNQITLGRINSTNDFLKDELTKFKPLPEGTVIMAEEQYAGRGQQQSQWHSEPGKNLTASLLLCPTFLPPSRAFQLSIAISLGLREALARILPEQRVQIKWPNDILVDGRKIAGILIENIFRGTNWKHAVVGIGVNVNQTFFSLKANNPCSICEILHETYDIQKLLNEICFFIEKHYQLLAGEREAELKEEYLRNLFGYEQMRTFRVKNELRQGKVCGIDEHGRLMVDFGQQPASFFFKEIEFILENN